MHALTRGRALRAGVRVRVVHAVPLVVGDKVLSLLALLVQKVLELLALLVEQYKY